jgi:hypothetical protein
MKTIQIKIKEEWLDALEDLLYAELTESEKVEAVKQCKQLWQELVKAQEKQNSK